MKQFCVISAPPDTYSGYGARSRDFIKALYELKKDEWDIVILPQRWGITNWGFTKDNHEEWGWMRKLFVTSINRQPDVWIQITVPNEFQPVGKVNIGVTAGIETTLCDASWIEGCNRMNVVLASSRHAKHVFHQSSFEQKDQAGNVVNRIQLQKPVEVLFEGVDLNKYFYKQELNKTELVSELDSIKESFCYLYVGHWLQGELGEDRKDTGMLIKTFLETFKDKKSKPALVLKTSQATACIMDRDMILTKIDDIRNTVNSNDLPNIYLLHGDLEDSDMNDLYNHPKVKAMVTFTKGEGYGRPLAEFCLSKKLVIASGWSGHTDFLNPEFTVLLPGQVKQVHQSAVVDKMILAQSGWFTADYKVASKYLEDVYTNYDKYEAMGKRQGHKIRTEFSFDNMTLLLKSYLDKYVPKQIQVKLPQLKKLDNKIELPKLKKIEQV